MERMPDEPGRVQALRCFLVPRFNMMTLTGALEPCRIANYLAPVPLYAPSFHSFDGSHVVASNGFSVACEPPPADMDRGDLVLVFASWGGEHYQNPELLSWLRLQARRGVRLCAVEIAAYIFARAGLLSERRTTTHWSYLSGLQEQFPDLIASEQLFTNDDPIWSCAGGTAVIDMMLELIENQHGKRLSGEIADQMMHHAARPGNTAQRVSSGRGAERLPAKLRAAVGLLEAHISEPIPVPEIAASVGLSQRQLERQFNAAMGCSVVQFGLHLRLQHARALLVSTDLSVRETAAASGFNSLSHFAYVFKRCFGKRPSDYRQAWPQQDATPQWPGALAGALESAARTRMREERGSDGLA